MINKVFLLGRISERGLTVRPLPESGAMQGSFVLVVDEPGRDGKVFSVWISCEAYGTALAQADALEPGELVCIEGKLKRRQRTSKTGETSWELCVLAWTMQRVQAPVGAEGRNACVTT